MRERQFRFSLFWSLELTALRSCVGVWPDHGLDCTFGLIKSGVMKREQAEGSNMFYTEENFDSPDKAIQQKLSGKERLQHGGVKRIGRECVT